MNRRNTIFIIAIIIALLLVGYIVYRGFFAGNSDQSALVNTKSQDVGPVTPILAKGTSLNFEPVKKYNSQGQLFNYPKTSPEEVGLPLPDLIK